MDYPHTQEGGERENLVQTALHMYLIYRHSSNTTYLLDNFRCLTSLKLIRVPLPHDLHILCAREPDYKGGYTCMHFCRFN